jgi:hypothetical protein
VLKGIIGAVLVEISLLIKKSIYTATHLAQKMSGGGLGGA